MSRPIQHEIGDRAVAIFYYRLPRPHVFREQTKNDYGIDGEVELFRDGKTTGSIFKVQIKGTEDVVLLADGTTIALNDFPIKTAEYLIEQVEIPSAIILVDVIRDNVYWTDLHSNPKLLQDYQAAKSSKQESFSVYFETNRLIPDDFSGYLKAMGKSGQLLALRQVSRIKPPTYAEYLEDIPDIDIELIQLHLRVDISNAEKLRRLIHAEQWGKADELASQILESTERSAQAKFDTILQTEQLFVASTNGQFGTYDKAEFDLWQAEQLTRYAASSGEKRLEDAAAAYSILAKLHYLVIQDKQLYMNWVANQTALENYTDSVEPFWFELLQIERSRLAKELLDTLGSAIEVVSNFTRKDYWVFLPDIITRLLWIGTLFLFRLNSEKLVDAVYYFQDWLDSILDFTVKLADKLNDDLQHDVIIDKCLIVHQMLLAMYKDKISAKQQLLTKALELTKKRRDKSQIELIVSELQELFDDKTQQDPNPQINWLALERYYRDQARALGINLDLANNNISDRDNPHYTDARIAWIINIGIQDLNPTRVLKNCRYLVYKYWGGMGIPAEMLQLPSAREKLIGCVLHPEHNPIATYSLDSVYQSFFEAHCKNCPDSKPHEDNWQYQESWHAQQIADWKTAQERFRNSRDYTDNGLTSSS